jgi:hypothetical protein
LVRINNIFIDLYFCNNNNYVFYVYYYLGFLLGIAMTMASLYPLSSLVKSIVEEKESKMKELMFIMGMPEWIHNLSWFITALILFTW